MMTRAEVQGFLSIRRFWEAERERNSLQTKRRKWLFTSATAEWISGQTVWSRTSGQRTETSRSAGLVVMEAPPEAMPLRVGSTSLHAHLKTIMYRYLKEKTDGWKRGGFREANTSTKGRGLRPSLSPGYHVDLSLVPEKTTTYRRNHTLPPCDGAPRNCDVMKKLPVMSLFGVYKKGKVVRILLNCNKILGIPAVMREFWHDLRIILEKARFAPLPTVGGGHALVNSSKQRRRRSPSLFVQYERICVWRIQEHASHVWCEHSIIEPNSWNRPSYCCWVF